MAKKGKKKKFSIRKLIRNLLIFCVVIFIGIYLFVIFATGAIVSPLIGKIVSPIIGAPLTIDDISVSPFLNGVTVKGITMGSPEGFKAESAFTLNHFNASIDLFSLFTDTIVINEIIIDGTSVTYEHDMGSLTNSNFTRINRNVQFFLGAVDEDGNAIVKDKEPEVETTTDEELTADKPAGIKRIIIKKFRFINGKMRLSNTLLANVSIPSPILPIKMDDIVVDIEEKMTLKEAIYEAGETIFKGCSDVAGALKLGELTESLGDGTKKAMGALGDGTKKTVDVLGKGLSSAGSTLTDGAKSIGEGVGSLLNVFGGSKDDDEKK